MTDLERAILHIKTRADAWAVKEIEKALSQEPCELLIIKSDIFLHQDDRKKWMESIKREKESGVIILPPYFEPLLVPANIEINIEQEPALDKIRAEIKTEISDYEGCADFNEGITFGLRTALEIIDKHIETQAESEE